MKQPFDISPDGYNFTALPEAPGYPLRQELRDEQTDWSVDVADYAPEEFTHPNVVAAEGIWADSTIEVVDIQRRELIAPRVLFDAAGRPLNPHGRTGITGRGLLGRFGANQVASAIFVDEEQGQVAGVQRRSGWWSLVSGFVDGDESLRQAALRELAEETGVVADDQNVEQILKPAIFVPDNLTTDNAWIEAAAFIVPCADFRGIELVAGTDALDAQWFPLEKALESFLPLHGHMLREYFQQPPV